MKYVNGIRIIQEILDSYNEYEILPPDSKDFIIRIIEDLKYNRNIQKDTLEHYQGVFPHLFEK